MKHSKSKAPPHRSGLAPIFLLRACTRAYAHMCNQYIHAHTHTHIGVLKVTLLTRGFHAVTIWYNVM